MDDEVAQEGEDPDFGLDVTWIYTTDNAVQIEPMYPMKMKFNGFEMSEFSNFILFLFVFSITYYVVLLCLFGL